jgi:hypothetical protein
MKIGMDTMQKSFPTGSRVAHPLAAKLSSSATVRHPIDLGLNIAAFLGGFYRLLVDLVSDFLAPVRFAFQTHAEVRQDEGYSARDIGPELGD